MTQAKPKNVEEATPAPAAPSDVKKDGVEVVLTYPQKIDGVQHGVEDKVTMSRWDAERLAGLGLARIEKKG